MDRVLRCMFVLGVLTASLGQSQSIRTSVIANDGTRLATDVYLPLVPAPSPVVLIRTPYNKNGMRDTCTVLSLLSYACVAQDVRGRYASEGTNTVFRDDGPDGRTTVDWIASQWWCDGRIGTFGGSALGITQYALAPGAGDALTCTMPAVATMDFYSHAAFQGGALRQELLYNWLDGQDALYFYGWLREHRLWDSWWEAAAIVPHAEEVRVPGLHVGGWYDIFTQGTLDAFDALQHRGGAGARGRQYVVVGPWTHASTGTATGGELTYPANAVIDLGSLAVDWLEHWLKGRDRGVDEWTPVRVYLMGAAGEPGAPGNHWLDLPDWPPAGPRFPLHLGEAGTLHTDVPTGGGAELLIDPADPVPTLGGATLFPDLRVAGRKQGAGPHDQRPIEARSDVLVFTTPPLDKPLKVIGRITAKIWITPDTPDLDLAVRLTDVYPDGRSMLVTDGIQRARMRCGPTAECFLTPGVPAEITVDLWSTALVFNAGHRIRVVVSGTNAPRFEVNPNTGGDLNTEGPVRVARPRLLFGPGHPSRVELPVVPDGTQPRRRVSRGGG